MRRKKGRGEEKERRRRGGGGGEEEEEEEEGPLKSNLKEGSLVLEGEVVVEHSNPLPLQLAPSKDVAAAGQNFDALKHPIRVEVEGAESGRRLLARRP
eukprot:626323-Hanusia_phi.AAC.1